jgi:hypothetical protein
MPNHRSGLLLSQELTPNRITTAVTQSFFSFSSLILQVISIPSIIIQRLFTSSRVDIYSSLYTMLLKYDSLQMQTLNLIILGH